MGAGHGHGASGGGLAAPDHRARLGVAVAVTATVLVAQAVGAVLTGSLALLTDTAHMLADSVGLLVALVAATVPYGYLVGMALGVALMPLARAGRLQLGR